MLTVFILFATQFYDAMLTLRYFLKSFMIKKKQCKCKQCIKSRYRANSLPNKSVNI